MISKSQISHIRSLHQKKFRDQYRQFIVEGEKMAMEVIDRIDKGLLPDRCVELYATPDFLKMIHMELAMLKAVSIWEVSDYELGKISTLKTPNQVLITLHMPDLNSQALNEGPRLNMFLENVQDPGNMGTIIRAADWYGIETIYCSNGSVDVYNPKVVQSTMGSILRVKVVYVNPEDIIKHCNAKGILLCGAFLEGESIYSFQTNKPIMLILGNESKGISSVMMNEVHHKITIPGSSNGCAESLNLAMAATIILSEFCGRRGC